MIGRWSSKIADTDEHILEPKGFDAFELRLGDIMRGERATMGKSLLDVQRELRIKASYIAAIENADPAAFDTPGFIAGYVRSYARYLGMDPDEAFATFCEESGFAVAHGMSAEASRVRKPGLEERNKRPSDIDLFARPNTPFAPAGESVLSRIEPSAIGSVLVLVALIGAIGYGGYSVLQEIQRVQVTPVDQTPVVLSDLDPLEGAMTTVDDDAGTAGFSAPRADALDRLYRPQALDVPVLVARDAPIATIDPRSVGNFTSPQPLPPAQAGTVLSANLDLGDDVDDAVSQALGGISVPQVLEGPTEGVRMVATLPSWVRVQAADGTVIFEKTMEPGDVFDVPITEEPPMLRTGNSGALYFALSDGCFGPVGDMGAITSNLPLNGQALAELYDPVDAQADPALNRMFADLAASDMDPAELAAIPCQPN
ncbi:MAG: RodZ domain-containing protein [Pseudomonadota bacterium]